MLLNVRKTPEFDIEKEAKKLTLDPMVTGASVIGIFYKDGIIIASDTQLSYGSLAEFKNVQRICKINDSCAFACTGEVSDFQEVSRQIEQIDHKSKIINDGIGYTPKDYANYLAYNQYKQRNKFDPYYTINIIGGFKNGTRYLAYVDIYGTLIENNYLMTGFANYLCKPLI